MSNDFTFSNNITTTLAESISSTSVIINVAPGTGSGFPTLGVGQIFPVTLVDAATGLTREICYCTSFSGDALTVSRGEEGTTARDWSAGDTVAHYITAGALNNYTQPTDLSSYATQSWVEALGYATQAWVTAQGYATQSWVNSQGYATQTFVTSQGYATQYYVQSYANGKVSGNTNGYMVLPSGMILQWGFYKTNSNGTGTVVFPIQFPNICLNVTVSEAQASGSWLNNNPTFHGVYNTPSQSSFDIITRGFINGQTYPVNPTAAAGYYQAIGF